MMGWRVGFIAFPSLFVKEEAMKCQDTIPVCATILSQIVALASTQVHKIASTQVYKIR
jgi:aspartate/methionine/tyrosine aminotransferase